MSTSPDERSICDMVFVYNEVPLYARLGTIVGLVASGHGLSEILAAYPYLEDEDIRQALALALPLASRRRTNAPAK
jgi:hypothetical protein